MVFISHYVVYANVIELLVFAAEQHVVPQAIVFGYVCVIVKEHLNKVSVLKE